MKTLYHTRYAAFSLWRNGAGYHKYLSALSAARIDLHPHQIAAALWAGAPSFGDGVILADEEGLGKTITAGIILSDAIQNDKKNLLVLCPKNLISHWARELRDKFDIEDGITIMSYTDAARNADELAKTEWDLCVLDEAHILANATLTDSAQSDAIHNALRGRRKILLTATPMQNSLLDLYYLVRLVDDKIFGGSPELFKKRYIDDKSTRGELVSRAQSVCWRTLKRQAITMQLPARRVRTIMVSPSDAEDALSKKMSLWFHRENLTAFPKIQEPYIRLTYWKLLASGTAALSASLSKVIDRLDDGEEKSELIAVRDMANEIKTTARIDAFMKTIADSFKALRASGAQKKILVFSENNTTLSDLYERLRDKYKVILSTPASAEKDIADFRRGAEIMLTGDHLGKGLDISFCSCVINFDVPWNVQKLEQRISRCHRYGQKHDVLVVNFIDPTNRADRRLYAVLNKKLKKFDEVFGASESVLGQLSDGILDADLRTESEIASAHEQFADENRDTIDTATAQAENDLLAHFDNNITTKFKFFAEQIPDKVRAAEDILWKITKRTLLSGDARIDDTNRSIFMSKMVYNGVRLSRLDFRMGADVKRGERYGFGTPLAKRILNDAQDGELQYGDITVRANDKWQSGTTGIIGVWRGYMLGKSYETFPIICGYTNDGRELSQDDVDEIIKLDVIRHIGGYYDKEVHQPKHLDPQLGIIKDNVFNAMKDKMLMTTNGELLDEIAKIERWCADETAALDMADGAIDSEIRILKSKSPSNMMEKLRLNKQIAMLDRRKKSDMDARADKVRDIAKRKDEMIANARRQCGTKFWDKEVFVLRFAVVPFAGEGVAADADGVVVNVVE